MTQKVLVTGATGFIAAHTIIELLNHGYEVRGTVRDLQQADRVRRLISRFHDGGNDLDIVAASLTEEAPWHDAVADCEGIFHLASPVPVAQPKNADDVIVPARDGALNVLKAAVAAGIQRVVLTSSVAAVSGHADAAKQLQTEHSWSNLEHSNTPYSQSKTIAERAAWEFADKHPELKLSSIQPAMVFGPALEADYGSSLEALLLLLRGAYPALPKLNFSIVDVRDVASLHRLVYESNEAIGRRYLCANGRRRFIEISRFMREKFPAYKKQLPNFELPSFAVRLLAKFDPVIATVVRDLELEVNYDTSPALSLGWQPRSAEDAIASGAESLIELGAV